MRYPFFLSAAKVYVGGEAYLRAKLQKESD